MTSSTEAAKAASQNQVTDADLLRICQSFNPGQDFDLAKAVRAEVLSKLHAPVAEIRIGVSATGRGTTICIMQPHADGSTTTIYSEMHPLGDSMGRAAVASAPVAGRTREAVDYVRGGALNFDAHPDGAPVAGEALWRGKFLPEHVTQQMIWNVQAVIEAECNGLALDTRQARNVMSFLMNEHGPDAAPQASADGGITASHDVATVVAFIFERFGLPGYAGQVPANVVAAVRRLEVELQTQAGKDSGHLVGHLGTTVTDVMVASLASLAYRYAMTLSFAARNADCDQVEEIARRVTAKLKDEIRAIISGQSGSSS
ncbi:hypothetical protein [Achromobacter xylosoxidans]|uniref:hypothetical protein n=1 Tax=Alcaligenes xylosoxydans xylosoxydans TaxID=85698 RepID=UPI001F1403BF|nr:hypothetical protein [Achromobacter xylosoxidans]